MRHLLLIALLLSACATKVAPTPMVIGPVVEAPMGCLDMRKLNPKADC